MSTPEEINQAIQDHERRLSNLEDGQEIIQDGITSLHGRLDDQDGRLDNIEDKAGEARDGIVALLGKTNGDKTVIGVLATTVRDICLSRFGGLIALALFIAVAGVGSLPVLLHLLGVQVDGPTVTFEDSAPEAVEEVVEASEPEEAPEPVMEPETSESPGSDDEAPVPDPEG